MKNQKFVFDLKDGKLYFEYKDDTREVQHQFEIEPTPATLPQPQLLNEVSSQAMAVGTPSDAPNLTAETPPEVVPLATPLAFEMPVHELPAPASVDAVVEEPEAPEPVVDLLVDSDAQDKPTVWVRMPEELPQIVSVDVAKINDSLVPESPYPQVVVDVSDATVEVPDGAVLKTVKTPEGKADIVVAISQAADEMKDVDVLAALQKAIDLWDDHPPLPDLTMTSPDLDPVAVLPQVVQVGIEDNNVHLKDISENIPDGMTMLPIVTPPGMPDIVAALDAETVEKFKQFNVDPAAEIARFIAQAKTEVASVKPVEEKKVLAPTAFFNFGSKNKLKRWNKWN